MQHRWERFGRLRPVHEPERRRCGNGRIERDWCRPRITNQDLARSPAWLRWHLTKYGLDTTLRSDAGSGVWPTHELLRRITFFRIGPDRPTRDPSFV
jgi:hypothetical protein